jgi:hypothetical protein
MITMESQEQKMAFQKGQLLTLKLTMKKRREMIMTTMMMMIMKVPKAWIFASP